LARYERGDIATFYFIIVEDRNNRRIQAWTDDKQLAKYYMEFHHSKAFDLKQLTKPIEEINKILDENTNDEINLYNIEMRDPDKKKPHMKTIQIPATYVEMQTLKSGCDGMMSDLINYSKINSMVPYLKPKWENGLSDCFLHEVMLKEIHSRPSPILEDLWIDQLAALFRLFPGMFGA
jgi:hypothetical protein